MGLNEILFKRSKRKKKNKLSLWGSGDEYTAAADHHKQESTSETPTETEEPILHVNSSSTPSIEVLSATKKESSGPAVISPGPDLSDVDRPPNPLLHRGGSEDTEDDAHHPGFRLPVEVQQQQRQQQQQTTTFRLIEENANRLFSAGHLSNYVEDEDDSFYLSATDTEGGPSTLATEDRTVFPNLPSEDDFTASSRSALDTNSNAPLRFNPKTGASLVPEAARKESVEMEDETKRQLEEAVRQINPIYPRHEVVESDSESTGGDDSRSDSDGNNDEDDSFYLSATDTEGPSAEFTVPKSSLLPSLRLSSPTDSPISAHEPYQNGTHDASTRTVASLMPHLEALSTPELNTAPANEQRSSKPRAESPRDVASSQPPLASETTSRNMSAREPAVVADLQHSEFLAPPSPNRAPRITIKTTEAKAPTPLKKLPAPTRDVRRKKIEPKLSPKREKTTANWFDPFSFEEWADFGCSNATAQSTQTPATSHQHRKGPTVEGLENLVKTAKTKSKKTSSSINSAPVLSRSTIQRERKTTCNDSVSDVLKTLESATSSRRSRSLSASRQAPKRPTRSSSRRKRSKSSDRQFSDQRAHLGISSDLESLSSGQSNRSARSGSVLGGRNVSQHRSVSGTESCHSSGHSTKSFTSHVSESSKSIAADLLRLERHLETIGGVHGRQQRGRRSRVTIAAPPGKLGVFLENRKESRGTVVTKVRPNSPLANLIHTGDRILAIDGADVSLMAVSEITSIMQRTINHERTLTVLKTTEDVISECEV